MIDLDTTIPAWCDEVKIRRCTDNTWYAEVEGYVPSAMTGHRLLRGEAFGDNPGDAVKAAFLNAERPTENQR